jgi:two-component system, NtrC family, sensor kinase
MSSHVPSLRREMLFSLSMLAAAALSVAVVSAILVQSADPRLAVSLLVLLIAGDVAVVVLFGRYLVERFVLRPMAALTLAAREIAAGDLTRRAPGAETRDFTDLATQFNQMTDLLLDAQSQLVRAEKLASIGRLAAGIAHEVGNPLSAIGTNVEVLRKRQVDPEIVAAIARETERIDRIVRGLLDYARPAKEQASVLDVAAVLQGTMSLLERQGVFRGMTVRLEPGPPCPAVRARAHDLEQVVINLMLNARDAAPGGAITVGLEPWVLQAATAPSARRSDPEGPRPPRKSRHPYREDLPPGTPGVLILVADSGTGVPPEDRERVFDPFFTTKDPGAGTGLGLAIVQRTVHELGGIVWVDDSREGGAAFKVFLPAAT